MRKLRKIRKKHGGRSLGKVTTRHQGGEHKRFHRPIDFRREKRVEGKVVAIEYDPNRTADIALIQYADGEKRYILSPQGFQIGDKVAAGDAVDIRVGNSLSLGVLPIGTVVHNVELHPGKGGQLARGAGAVAILVAKEEKLAHLKLPSGEIRKVPNKSMATIGQVGNIEWKNEFFGKAGRKRHMGIRPTVRGVAQNPRSHPHGGGEARSGIGMSTPMTYAGRPAVGKRRRRHKYSNKYIVQRRKS